MFKCYVVFIGCENIIFSPDSHFAVFSFAGFAPNFIKLFRTLILFIQFKQLLFTSSRIENIHFDVFFNRIFICQKQVHHLLFYCFSLVLLKWAAVTAYSSVDFLIFLLVLFTEVKFQLRQKLNICPFSDYLGVEMKLYCVFLKTFCCSIWIYQSQSCEFWIECDLCLFFLLITLILCFKVYYTYYLWIKWLYYSTYTCKKSLIDTSKRKKK